MSQTSLDSLFISTFKRRSGIVLATFISTIGASALYLAATPPQYETSAQLIVGEQDVSVSNLGQQLTDKNTKTPGRTADPVATQAELVKSNKVLKRALKNFQESTGIPNEELPDLLDLQKNIDVDILPATNILKLVYHYPDPELAARLLNSVAQSVVQENIETNRLQASNLREFLEDQIDEQKWKLEQAETEESEYRQAESLVNFETQSQNLISSLTELENEERHLVAKLKETTATRDLLKQTAGVDNLDKADQVLRIGKDEAIQKLQTQLQELEAKISNRRSYLTDKAPELQNLLEERDDLRAVYEQQLSNSFYNKNSLVNNLTSNPYSQDLIAKYISSQVEQQALESKLQTVRVELKNLKNRVTRIPTYQKPLAKLIRQRETAEASLKFLQSKLEEAKIAETQSTSNTRIVSAAEINNIPVSPKPAAVLVIGTTSGIFLAIGAVFCLGLIDDGLYNAKNAEETLKLPILGVLPNISTIDNSPDLNQFLDNSLLVEPYRTLLKTLESSSINTTSTIVMSSIAPEEGKSSAALYLAATAAMLSRRTLIIDADLLQPMQHQLFDVSPYPGLTEVLKNPSTFISVARPTAITNLSVLTYGQMNNRPAALIESRSMKTLLEAVAEFYDLVIVDSSATSICSDAATLSQFTDGVILVVRPNFISKEMILAQISQLKQINAKISGVVINEFDKNQTRYLNGKKDSVTRVLPF